MRFLQYVCKMPIKANYKRKGTKTFSTIANCGVKTYNEDKETTCHDGF